MPRSAAPSLILLSLSALTALEAGADETRAPAAYARFELHDIVPKVTVQPAAMEKLRTELGMKLNAPIARWNADGLKPGHAGTLAIEIEITQMRYVSGKTRFWAGSYAGVSRATALVKLLDAESGRVLLTREFHDQADSVSGTYSVGASDNAMLDRLAANVGMWVIATHDRSSGLTSDTMQAAPAN